MDDGSGGAQGTGTAGVRKILHADLDAAFASIEQRDDPSLRGRPVAVGGSRERGVVAAASYEARAFGVRSAMPSVIAARRCPGLVFVRPRFDVYREVSARIREIFHEFTDLVEPLSLDEAYLDVTENKQGIGTATEIARLVKERVRTETGLTISVGVSYCRFLAKIASDYRKPDGLFVITPRMGPAFVEGLEIGRFHGIGPATEARMTAMGIRTGGDLRAVPLEVLRERFGKAGEHYHRISRGIDERPVVPDRVRKSSGAETTFDADLREIGPMSEALVPLVDKAWRHCRASGAVARTATLKVKYADFRQVTRARSTGRGYADEQEVLDAAVTLLTGLFPLRDAVRLLGVSLSGFGDPAGGAADDRDPDQFALPL